MFDDQVDDEKLLTMYETENLSLLEPIYKRFDEQFKLLQEQRFAQRVEAERAESHRVKMEHLFDEFGARVKHTEMGLEALRQEAAAMVKRIRALEQRAVTWDSIQERVESIQAELVTDICMHLREKYEGEFKTNQQQLSKQQSEFSTIQQQLANQRSELNKLKQSLRMSRNSSQHPRCLQRKTVKIIRRQSLQENCRLYLLQHYDRIVMRRQLAAMRSRETRDLYKGMWHTVANHFGSHTLPNSKSPHN